MGNHYSKDEQWKLGYPNGYGKRSSRETANMDVTNGLVVTSDSVYAAGENTSENLWANIAFPDVNRPAFLMLPNAKHLIESRRCTHCKNDINPAEFVVDTWLDEYKISGMCVICQNSSFDQNQSIAEIVQETEEFAIDDSITIEVECDMCGNGACTCRKMPCNARNKNHHPYIKCSKCNVTLATLNRSAKKIVQRHGPCYCSSDPYYRARKREKAHKERVRLNEPLCIKVHQYERDGTPPRKEKNE